MTKTKIPKSVSKYMSELSKRRDPEKLREHLLRISKDGVKARRRKAKKRT
jgi:hypothetical protein